MRFTHPYSGGSAPERRSTAQTPSSSPTLSRVPRGAWTKRALPTHGGAARQGAAGLGRVAVRAEWDGFRGVLENDAGELALWSRNGRPLLRYFPELRPLGDLLPPNSALDGEIVISKGGKLDFDSMQLRLHPAESRIRKLSAEIPAQLIAFDVLLWNGEPLHQLPLEKR